MNTPEAIRNAALAASAGTGKTFALSSRYLALLASGVDPVSIVALTFTRKAAGEILARILARLAKAAATPASFQELTGQLAEARLPGFPDRANARAALQRLVHELPRLRIGTLDSFFLQILRQFRLEAGIGPELAIMQELDAPEENRVLQNLLQYAPVSTAQRRELLEAFKRATFGEERKSIFATLARLVQSRHELFQRASAAECWGSSARIWPPGTAAPVLLPPEPDWPGVFSALEAQAESLRPGDRKAWEKFLENLRQVQAGDEFEFNSVLDTRLYAAFAPGDSAAGSISFGRGELMLLPAARTALAAVFMYIRGTALARQIVRTTGLQRLLAAYDREHRLHIARTGQLSFNDIAQFLAPASGRIPTRFRLLMDGRLDARFCHWLLDEFQDTSLIQWAVIENLIDEVVQNPDADRTLFYVGDAKQAIYEWRNGDPRLFRRILAKYNRPGRPPAIEEMAPLVRSWRSSPDILHAVNCVFRDLPRMPLPQDDALRTDWSAIAARWHAEWTDHEAAGKNQHLPGHVALHILPRLKGDESGPTPMARTAELVRQLENEITGFKRFSVAILTRSNTDGLVMLEALAALGIHAVWAGNSPLLDNALLPAILSLAILIEHPGDTFARGHVEMSPLAGRVDLTPGRLADLGRLICAQGYAGLVSHLAAILDLSGAPLELARLRTLATVAAEFDRQPGPTALRFAAFVQALELPAEETGSNIQILTMHKAKGLEYDIVFLPALGTKGITAGRKPDLLVHESDVTDPIPPVDWILSAPENPIIEAEPPLAMQLACDRQDNALEELRLLYVAMTRAKRALYLITTEPASTSTTLRLDHILQKTLAPTATAHAADPVWQTGSSTWWRKSPPGGQAASPCAPLDFDSLPQAPIPQPLGARIASQDSTAGEGRAGWIFRPENAAARDLGTRIHALFEQIEWLTPGVPPGLPAEASEESRLVAAFLHNPANHLLFEKPAGPVELLREQAFEVILDGRWLSGKIDRLQLVRDLNGMPVHARIFDFKSDWEPVPERHRAQMEDYRRAVAQLFGLSPRQITCTLLFIRAGKIVDL